MRRSSSASLAPPGVGSPRLRRVDRAQLRREPVDERPLALPVGDPDHEPGERLQIGRLGVVAGVDRIEAGRADQVGDGLLRGGVVTGEDQRRRGGGGIGEELCEDGVERLDGVGAGGQRGDRSSIRAAREVVRGVDQHLAVERARCGEDVCGGRGRHGEQYHLGGSRRLRDRVPRRDDDVVPRCLPALRERAADPATSEDPDLHLCIPPFREPGRTAVLARLLT